MVLRRLRLERWEVGIISAGDTHNTMHPEHPQETEKNNKKTEHPKKRKTKVPPRAYLRVPPKKPRSLNFSSSLLLALSAVGFNFSFLYQLCSLIFSSLLTFFFSLPPPFPKSLLFPFCFAASTCSLLPPWQVTSQPSRPCMLDSSENRPPLFQKCCQLSRGGEKKKKLLVLRGFYNYIMINDCLLIQIFL